MRTTAIQIARILDDSLTPADLARVVEVMEGYPYQSPPEPAAKGAAAGRGLTGHRPLGRFRQFREDARGKA